MRFALTQLDLILSLISSLLPTTPIQETILYFSTTPLQLFKWFHKINKTDKKRAVLFSLEIHQFLKICS